VTRAVALDLDPAHYRRSSLHAESCVWVEKNCYVDLWIETLHALGHDPVAMMPTAFAVDFEGDQWTFFKPSLEDIRHLYGVDVQELTVWRPLIEHVLEHVGAGKLVSTEADAFWLPDTAGTDYRRKHSKTTIVIASIDTDARELRYFHNAGFFALRGEDFDKLFMLDAAPPADFLPLYAEVVRFDRQRVRPVAELAALSFELVRRTIGRVPATNPIVRFRERLEQDLPLLQQRGLDYYHAWAFGTVRQLGVAFELAAANLDWLAKTGADVGAEILGAASAPFRRIAEANKTLILKAARSVNSRKALDTTALFAEQERAWEEGMAALQAHPRLR
jgi:hypothetical protein